MKRSGLIYIFIAIALPLLWYIPLTGQHNSAAIYSQYLGSISLIMMGITQFMATRVRAVEPIFGPLDQVYGLHKWLGIGAIVTAFLHSNIDAEAGNLALIPRLADAAEDWGELAYNGLIFLVIISLITIIPYKLWKWTHKLIGLTFALAAFHYILIEKPFTVLEPLGLYITFFCIIGIVAYVYQLLPRWLGHNSVTYTVTDVQQHKDITELSLKPVNRGIAHTAGQFAFVNFQPFSLLETHPYTISSAPNAAGVLNFKVKSLGSYTRRMGKTLQPGVQARVSAPYGHFVPKSTKGSQIWVGGGIGITPFIAWAETLTPDWPTPTKLYYCVSSREDALYIDQFERIAAAVPNFEFVLVVSSEGTRLSAERIDAEIAHDMSEGHVYFCGPAKMRQSLKSGLVSRGLKRSNFHNEEFEMRSGLGILNFLRRFI